MATKLEKWIGTLIDDHGLEPPFIIRFDTNTLAKNVNITPQGLLNAIGRLEEAGIIEIVKRGKPNRPEWEIRVVELPSHMYGYKGLATSILTAKLRQMGLLVEDTVKVPGKSFLALVKYLRRRGIHYAQSTFYRAFIDMRNQGIRFEFSPGKDKPGR